MVVVFAPGVSDAVRQHSQEAYPDEACGILIGSFRGPDIQVDRCRRTPNAAGRDRGRAFALHARDLLAAEDEARQQGLEVVGFYHSHPDVPASPSQADDEAAWPGYVHVIVSVLRGDAQHVSAWSKRADGRLVEQALVLPTLA